MAINKIVIGNEVKIDLTADTVTAASMLKGVTAHDKSGEIIEGSCSFDVDSSDATATAAEVLEGKTYAARGKTFTGTMPNKGSVNGSTTRWSPGSTMPRADRPKLPTCLPSGKPASTRSNPT